MKANELMVGDWIRIVNDDTDQSFETRISGVSGLGNIYAPLPEGEHAYPFGVDCIEPIPLTPEILEKNGFKKLGFDGWDFDYETEGGCLIYEVLWRCDYPKEYHTHLTIKSFSPDFGSFMSFRIDSVHELQHALRLCGIDKEIVL